MIVSELIGYLQRLPSDTRVFVDGYEGGLADPSLSPPVLVDLNVIPSPYFGAHALHGEGWDDPKQTIEAVILRRGA